MALSSKKFEQARKCRSNWLSALNHAEFNTIVIRIQLCWMCRSSANKVLPAMYIEEETDLAFDDVTPEDPDFAAIQGIDIRAFKSYWIHPF